MKKLTRALGLLFLVSLAIVACSSDLATEADSRTPSATPSIQYQTAVVKTPTLEPVPPTVIKPTATFVPLVTPSPTADIPRIGVDEAKVKVDAGEAVIVDVRDAATYEREHIAGAISMPVSEVAERYTELPTDELVIFYCA